MSLTHDQSFRPSMNGCGKNRTFDGTENERLQQPHYVANISSLSAYSLTDLAPETVFEADWPPSIRQAAEDALYSPSQVWSPDDVAIGRDASPNRTSYPAPTATPLSFYGRSLEMARPYMDYGFERLPDDTMSPISSGRDTNSAIDNFDDIFSPVNSDETAGSRTSGSSVWSEHGSQSGVLQYHLLGAYSPDVIEKENLPIRLKALGKSHLDISTSSNDVQTLACPLCPNKQYTGHWAHRNLHRHMESKHSACASADGVKHIRCSQEGCNSTFGREDARLVHERRSHPELNTPPPKKRKRTDED